jgi:sugar O-acyltransferase (sialic acid O-acetyltransferase NeuD family)
MSNRPLVIIGNSEIAAMAFEYFTFDSDYDVAAFAVEPDYIQSDAFEGRPLVSLDQATSIYPPAEFDAFVAIGDTHLNRVRRRMVEWARSQGYSLASYVSSKAFVWRNVTIGENCFILENNVLQPFVEVGDNVTLWSGNHIGHRSVIEDDVFIASHVVVSGFCRVGRSSFLGVNAALAHGVSIAPDNFISMGAVVTRSTQPDSVYQGHPAERRDVTALRYCRVPSA